MTRWVLLMLALAAAGCKKPRPPPVEDAPLPVDHLAHDEVPGGVEKAFALQLPRDSHIFGRLSNTVLVRSALEPEAVSNYVRARVKSGKATIGATATTFENVIVPAEPTRQLTIEIRRANGPGMRTSLTIRDSTPSPPVEIPPDEAWRKAGLTPDGKLLDPKKVE